MVHHLHTDFILKDCFSGAIKLTKNAYRKIFSLNTLINILILNAVFDLIHDYIFLISNFDFGKEILLFLV